MKWTKDRIAELELLQQLVTEVQSLNTGSGVIARLEKCIEIAAKLDRNETIKTPRAGFIAFLNQLCADEREQDL